MATTNPSQFSFERCNFENKNCRDPMFWVTVGCMTEWFQRAVWSLVYTMGLTHWTTTNRTHGILSKFMFATGRRMKYFRSLSAKYCVFTILRTSKLTRSSILRNGLCFRVILSQSIRVERQAMSAKVYQMGEIEGRQSTACLFKWEKAVSIVRILNL